MKWVTIFERYEDFHFVKDVGQVPYHASKILNYDVELWRKGFNENIEVVDGFNLITINANEKTTKVSMGIVKKIIVNARKINVLQLFHLRKYSLVYALVYKIFNPKGYVVIKCDATDCYPNFSFFNKIILFIFLRIFINKITVEHKSWSNFFSENNIRVEYIPNGVSELYYKGNSNVQKKSVPNMCFVGKCGDERKNVWELINALSRLPQDLEWCLNCVGGETDSFKIEIEKYFNLHPHLKEKIVFRGFVNPDVMKELYSESHIFIMTSLSEGYPLSTIEACWMGCCPILSKNSGGNDLIKSSDGYIYEDENNLAEILQSLILNIDMAVKKGAICSNYVKKNNDWRDNIKRIARVNS